MQRIITDILTNLEDQDSPTFSVKEMQVAVAAKKAKRQDKDQDFLCYVLDDTTQPSQLANFFSHQESTKQTARFQLVYKVGEHWSAADVNIQDQKIQVLLVDAANSMPHILHTVQLIRKHCPSASLFYCGLSIQSDLRNCATFALDHVFLLSKLKNLHITLPFPPDGFITLDHYARYFFEKNSDKVKSNLEEIYKDAMAVNCLISSSLDDTFACLLRNIQTLAKLQGRFKDKLTKSANATTSLQAYIDARTILDEQGQKVNVAIDVKRRHIKQKTLKFFREFEEVQHLSTKRQKPDAPNDTTALKPPQ